MLKFFSKNKLIIGVLVLGLILGLTGPVFAEDYGDDLFQNKTSYKIEEIRTQADIDKEGTMTLRQKWVFDDASTDGTEHYIVFDKDTLRDLELRDVQVFQNGKALEEVPWDVDASFSEKAGKFGFNETYSTLELCFGIGEKIKGNTYEISYKVDKVIEETTDGAYFLHWKFINDELSDPVGKVRLEITFPNEVKKIFGFGYEGIVAMSDSRPNTVVLENGKDLPIRSNNQVIALVEVEGPFGAVRTRDQSRMDLYEEAFEGSSYTTSDLDSSDLLLAETQVLEKIDRGETYNVEAEEGPPIGYIIALAVMFPIMIVLLLVGLFNRNRIKVDLKRRDIKDSYFRDNVSVEPNQMLKLLVQEYLTNLQGIILYYFLRWVNQGLLDIEKDEKKGFFGKVKEIDVFYFTDLEPSMEPVENMFFDFFKDEASYDSTRDQMKLSTEDLKKIDYSDLDQDFQKYLKSPRAKEGISQFIEKKKKKEFLNEEGKRKLLEYYGMKNFLKDFTLMNEREVQEVKLWAYHLELAGLLGLAEKVQEQLKVYPQVYRDTNVTMNAYTASTIMHSVNSSLTTAMGPSGSGGYSSTGGGGGFSGGGSGGGTR